MARVLLIVQCAVGKCYYNMKKILSLITIILLGGSLKAQVDTSYIYGPRFGDSNIDLRIYINENNYYYLDEGKTFSYRAVDGVPTNTYSSMAGFNSSQYTEGHLRRKNGPSTSQFIMNYRLLFPLQYNENYEEGYPLIIMLHGYGERGNCRSSDCHWATRSWNPNVNNPPAPPDNGRLLNNDHNLLHGGRQHQGAVNLAAGKLPNDPTLSDKAFPGFVLFPQNLNGWGGSLPSIAYDVIKLIRLMTKRYNIDQNRIYIEGLSEGGSALYHVIRRAPWLFSAAVSFSAINDGGINYHNLQSEIVTIPLRTFQGGKDADPTPGETRGYVNNFRNAGLEVVYELYPHLGHGTWNAGYGEPDFFSWMLGKTKANPHIKYGVDYICGTTGAGVEMIFAKGFFAYQWEKDGVIIPDATTHAFTATTPGTYRGRFSRVPAPGPNDWNRWSDPIVIQEKTLPAPTVSANYSTIFPNINNDNTVTLSTGASEYTYHWYRNGALVNFPFTNQDDTVMQMTVTNYAYGEGDYIVKNVDGSCEGLSAETVYVRYGTSETLTAPTNLTGTATSASSAYLSWTDNSSNESGFEIWRRKGTSGKFTFVARTNSNAISFSDSGLEPSMQYHYKIRAVSNTSRSAHAPSNDPAVNVIVTTLVDTESPNAPQNLTVRGNTSNSITLSWDAATDNTGIRQYIITYGSNTVATGSNTAQYKISGLTLNASYTITVKAEDLSGKYSPESNQVTGTTYVNGLYYEHSTGAWLAVNDIDWHFVEYTGSVNNFTLIPRTQEDFFNFLFDGYIYIPESGTYQFQIFSNDGSMLFLDGFNKDDLTQSRIIDNNTGNKTVDSEEIYLTQGPHRIVALYFEHMGSQSITVRYRKRDSTGAGWSPDWTAIPDAMLTSGTHAPPSSLPAPTGLTATSSGISRINLTWTYTGGSATDQFEIYRSTQPGGTYAIVGRVGNTTYGDTDVVPGTTYYYKLKSISGAGSTSDFSSVAQATTDPDNEAPSVPANLQVLNTNPESVSLTWNASSDNARVTGYYVYVNGTLAGSTATPGYMVNNLSPATSYNITVKAYDQSNNVSAASAALTVTTSNGNRICNFQLDASDHCGDAPVTVHVLQTEAGTSYVASMNGIDISETMLSTGEDLVLSVSAEHFQEGSNTVTVTADTQCGTDPLAKQIIINVTAAPVTSVANSTISVCAGSEVVLTATGAPQGGKYIWYDSEGSVVSESADGTYTIPSADAESNLQVSAVHPNGCAGPLVDVAVIPEAVPVPVIFMQDNSLTVTTEFSDEIFVAWYKDMVPLPETGTSIVHSGEGLYFVTLTLNGCTMSSDSLLVNEEGEVITGLEPETRGEELYYTYPNPVKTDFFIHALRSSSEPLIITVTDMTGKIFYAGEMTRNGSGLYRLAAPDYMVSGSYIVTIMQGDKQIRKRIAVVR